MLSRRLAAVLPVTVVLLVVGQTLTPHGLDKPITTTAAALRELPIAAAHAGRLYLANNVIGSARGAVSQVWLLSINLVMQLLQPFLRRLNRRLCSALQYAGVDRQYPHIRIP